MARNVRLIRGTAPRQSPHHQLHKPHHAMYHRYMALSRGVCQGTASVQAVSSLSMPLRTAPVCTSPRVAKWSAALNSIFLQQLSAAAADAPTHMTGALLAVLAHRTTAAVYGCARTVHRPMDAGRHSY